MYNNDDIMNRLDEINNVLYKLNCFYPQLFIVDKDDLDIVAYKLIDFIDFFNNPKRFGVKKLENFKLFLDKDDAIEYLKDLEIKDSIKELVEVDDEI